MLEKPAVPIGGNQIIKKRVTTARRRLFCHQRPPCQARAFFTFRLQHRSRAPSPGHRHQMAGALKEGRGNKRRGREEGGTRAKGKNGWGGGKRLNKMKRMESAGVFRV